MQHECHYTVWSAELNIGFRVVAWIGRRILLFLLLIKVQHVQLHSKV